jgi:hypothetical protein
VQVFQAYLTARKRQPYADAFLPLTLAIATPVQMQNNPAPTAALQ